MPTNDERSIKMDALTCRLRLVGRSPWDNSLLAKLIDVDGVQTRKEACTVIDLPVEQRGAGHSEGTPVETAFPVETPVSAKRVVEAGSPALGECVGASAG